MIDADKRKALFLLHNEGMPLRELSRRFGLSRNTVREIVKQRGEMAETTRKDKIAIDLELLSTLYTECNGYAQRVWEKLREEDGIEMKYSTLTQILRSEGISKSPAKRCDRVPDKPGEEMQHDTTVYKVLLGGVPTKLIASALYLRYSKRRYLKLYRRFNRFKMKCFLHEALMHWGFSAENCIIDNTNLARLRGIGRNAVIVPEMKAFGKQYGFNFCCHEKGHANRKAGEERTFWTVETNFLPGRTFTTLEDLNCQALEWSTVRMEHRPLTKAGIIPAKAFDYEQRFLKKLPPYLPAPYRVRTPDIDQYGYIALNSNFYWVPKTGHGEIKVLEYDACFKIYQGRKLVVEYVVPPDGTKNKPFPPPGQLPPRHKPANRKNPTKDDEKHLREMSESVSAYLDFSLPSGANSRHCVLHKLTAVSRKMTPELFVKCIERAHKYRITDVNIIQNIALRYLGESTHELPLVELTEHLQGRDTYLEGAITEKPDLSVYQDEEEEENE